MQSCPRNNSNIQQTHSRSNSVDNNQPQPELTAQRITSSNQTPITTLAAALPNRLPFILSRRLRAAFGLSFSSREIKRNPDKFEPAYLMGLAARNPKKALKFIERANSTLKHRDFNLDDPKVALFFTLLSAFSYRYRFGRNYDKPKNKPNFHELRTEEKIPVARHPEFNLPFYIVDEPYNFLLFDESLNLTEKEKSALLRQIGSRLESFASKQNDLLRAQQETTHPECHDYFNMNLSDAFFANGQFWYQPPGSNVVLTLEQGYQYICNWRQGRVKPGDLENAATLAAIRAIAPSDTPLPAPVLVTNRDDLTEARRIVATYRQNGFPAYIQDQHGLWVHLANRAFESLALSDNYPCSISMLRCKMHAAGYKETLLTDDEITAFAAEKGIQLVTNAALMQTLTQTLANVNEMELDALLDLALHFNEKEVAAALKDVSAAMQDENVGQLQAATINLIAALTTHAKRRTGYESLLTDLHRTPLTRPAARSPQELAATGFELLRFDYNNRDETSPITSHPSAAGRAPASGLERQDSVSSIRIPRASIAAPQPMVVLTDPIGQGVSIGALSRAGNPVLISQINLTGLLPPPQGGFIFMTRLELRDILHRHGIDADQANINTATLHQIAHNHGVRLLPQSAADRQKLQQRQRAQVRH